MLKLIRAVRFISRLNKLKRREGLEVTRIPAPGPVPPSPHAQRPRSGARPHGARRRARLRILSVPTAPAWTPALQHRHSGTHARILSFRTQPAPFFLARRAAPAAAGGGRK